MNRLVINVMPGAMFALALAGCGVEQSKLAFRQAPVVRSSLVRTVDATGKVTPRNSSDGIPVGAQVTGKIVKLFVDYNSPVTNGQVVALVDPTSYQAIYDAAAAQYQVDQENVTVAEAMVGVAKSQYDYCELCWQRKSALDKKALPELERDKARSDFQTAKAELARAQAQLGSARSQVAVSKASAARAKADLDYCTIRSPVNGVVIARKIEEGETVVSTYNTSPILTIAEDLRTVWVETTVPEADVGGVRVGQKVVFTADAYNRKFTGTVKQIRRAANKTNNVVTYPVIVEAENPDEMLFPGMTATISIETGRVSNAPVVTVAALRFAPKPEERTAAGEEGKTVWIANAEGKLDPVAVKPGLSDDSFIVLEGGETLVGKQVVVGYQSTEASKENELNNPFMPKQKSSAEEGK